MNYAQLYINGQYWGPYINVQQLNGEYMREWFLSNDGTRWRAEQAGGFGGPGGGGPGGGNFGQGTSTLNYLDADTTDYIAAYTLNLLIENIPNREPIALVLNINSSIV